VIRRVIDSTVFIDASREPRSGAGPATAFLVASAQEGELWSVTPVRTEVRWAMRTDEAALVDALLDRVFWLDVTADLADRAGEFGRRYGRSHGLDVVDALVAAAAELLSADVATTNVRDFPMFPGLARPY
jgi:predicted nucleic acid-binding protein